VPPLRRELRRQLAEQRIAYTAEIAAIEEKYRSRLISETAKAEQVAALNVKKANVLETENTMLKNNAASYKASEHAEAGRWWIAPLTTIVAAGATIGYAHWSDSQMEMRTDKHQSDLQDIEASNKHYTGLVNVTLAKFGISQDSPLVNKNSWRCTLQNLRLVGFTVTYTQDGFDVHDIPQWKVNRHCYNAGHTSIKYILNNYSTIESCYKPTNWEYTLEAFGMKNYYIPQKSWGTGPEFSNPNPRLDAEREAEYNHLMQEAEKINNNSKGKRVIGYKRNSSTNMADILKDK
jgi:hypothetical protein